MVLLVKTDLKFRFKNLWGNKVLKIQILWLNTTQVFPAPLNRQTSIPKDSHKLCLSGTTLKWIQIPKKILEHSKPALFWPLNLIQFNKILSSIPIHLTWCLNHKPPYFKNQRLFNVPKDLIRSFLPKRILNLESLVIPDSLTQINPASQDPRFLNCKHSQQGTMSADNHILLAIKNS